MSLIQTRWLEPLTYWTNKLMTDPLEWDCRRMVKTILYQLVLGRGACVIQIGSCFTGSRSHVSTLVRRYRRSILVARNLGIPPGVRGLRWGIRWNMYSMGRRLIGVPGSWNTINKLVGFAPWPTTGPYLEEANSTTLPLDSQRECTIPESSLHGLWPTKISTSMDGT
jgi:hypothetical protein